MKIVTLDLNASQSYRLPTGTTIVGAYYNKWLSSISVDVAIWGESEGRDYEFQIITPATSELEGAWSLPVPITHAPLGHQYVTWRYK